jgi:hypothetical protein
MQIVVLLKPRLELYKYKFCSIQVEEQVSYGDNNKIRIRFSIDLV